MRWWVRSSSTGQACSNPTPKHAHLPKPCQLYLIQKGAICIFPWEGKRIFLTAARGLRVVVVCSLSGPVRVCCGRSWRWSEQVSPLNLSAEEKNLNVPQMTITWTGSRTKEFSGFLWVLPPQARVYQRVYSAECPCLGSGSPGGAPRQVKQTKGLFPEGCSATAEEAVLQRGSSLQPVCLNYLAGASFTALVFPPAPVALLPSLGKAVLCASCCCALLVSCSGGKCGSRLPTVSVCRGGRTASRALSLFLNPGGLSCSCAEFPVHRTLRALELIARSVALQCFLQILLYKINY